MNIIEAIQELEKGKAVTCHDEIYYVMESGRIYERMFIYTDNEAYYHFINNTFVKNSFTLTEIKADWRIVNETN